MTRQEKIEGWVSAAGYSVESLPVEEGTPPQWLSRVNYPNPETTCALIGLKFDVPLLLVQRFVDVSEQHQAALRELSEMEYLSFRRELLKRVLGLNVEFSHEQDSSGMLIEVGAQKRIWGKNLSRQSVFDALYSVVKSTWLQTLLIREAAGAEL